MSIAKKKKIVIDFCRELSIMADMKRNTVNVIEIVDGTIKSLQAWDDNAVGNAEAEKIFRVCIEENTKNDTVPPDESDMNGYVEDGIFEQGTYQVNLVHSID